MNVTTNIVFEILQNSQKKISVMQGGTRSGKQTFATHFAEGSVEDLVALGGHAQNRYVTTPRLQQVLQMVGLPQSQAAFAGGDGEVNGAQNKAGWTVNLRLNASM